MFDKINFTHDYWIFILPLVFMARQFFNTMPALWSTMVAYVVVICAGSAIRWRRGRWKTHRLV